MMEVSSGVVLILGHSGGMRLISCITYGLIGRGGMVEIYFGRDVCSLVLALGFGFISKQLGGEGLGLLDWEEGKKYINTYYNFIV